MTNTSGSADEVPARRKRWPRLIAASVLVMSIVMLTVFLRKELHLSYLVAHEDALRQFQRDWPITTGVIALATYAVVSGLLPISVGMSLLYGWYFGFWRGVLLVSFGSTAGATLELLLSRYLLRDFVEQRFGDRLRRVNAELKRDGAFYLLTLRLLPVFPFYVVNAVMGLTPIRTRTFWWVSQLGMLPATMVYVYAGSTAPNLRTLAERGVHGLPMGRIAIALALLGALPLTMRLLVRSFRGQEDAAEGVPDEKES